MYYKIKNKKRQNEERHRIRLYQTDDMLSDTKVPRRISRSGYSERERETRREKLRS